MKRSAVIHTNSVDGGNTSTSHNHQHHHSLHRQLSHHQQQPMMTYEVEQPQQHHHHHTDISRDGHANNYLPLDESSNKKNIIHHVYSHNNNNNNSIDNIVEPSMIVVPNSNTIQQQHHQSKSQTKFYQILYNTKILSSLDAKKIISSTVFTFLFLLICDSMFSTKESRIIQPNFANSFLLWVQIHPSTGIIWILIVMSIAVICMIPIGTPLTLGCGYIYKGAYGWKLGIFIATIVSMAGSALGAVICFLLGRYMMRNTVKRWIRKYPIFDAIDIAAAEHGLRIMAMLYLTPILPLGPVSYMCGTTSLKLSHFIIAKIAALPLMLLYVIIGASTGTLISSNNSNNDTANTNVKSIEDNETLIISGIILSFASIAGITHYIKKELNHILERQKRQLENKEDGIEITSSSLLLSSTSDHNSSNNNTTPNNFNKKSITLMDIETSIPKKSTIKNDGTIIMIDSYNNAATNTTPNHTISSPLALSSSNTDHNTIIDTTSTIPTTAPRQRKH